MSVDLKERSAGFKADLPLDGAPRTTAPRPVEKTYEHSHGDHEHNSETQTGTSTTAATSTTADEATSTISASSTVTGVINTGTDTDHFNIYLVKGETYSISLKGSGSSPLIDAMLTLTKNGVQVAMDDDGGQATDSLLTFTATATGTYQITAAAYPESGLTGEYTLAVRKMGSDTVGSTRSSADDIANDGTTYGFIESSGDVDMYAVTLVEGQYYSFDLAGGTDYASTGAIPPGELNTNLTVYDSNGNQVAQNGDLSSEDRNSGVGFVAADSGTYYVRVSASTGQTGGYTLDVQETDLSTADPLDSLDWGTELSSNVVMVYFAPKGETHDGIKSLGWTSYEIGRAMAALDEYADVSDLTFIRTTDASQATFTLVTTTSEEFLGYFNPPGTTNAGVGVFATNANSWNDTGGLEEGGAGFATLLHEFGHGLGLAHPHDNGGTSTVMPGVNASFDSYGVFNLNQGVYTTMSYNDSWQLHPNGPVGPNATYGFQASPGALDIALIQQKYGAGSHASGSTIYTLPSANAAGTFYDVIWDTGGTDTIRHTGTVSAQIDLTAATLNYSATGGGVISYVNGIRGGFTIAAGVVIENATGGTGNDVLIGNHVANVLTGGAGADRMEGRDGNDTYKVDNSGDKAIEGFGEGTDRVTSSVSFNLGGNVENLTLTGSAGLTGTGNGLNNEITGNAGANTLSGLGGNDTLNGGAGADARAGGSGNDLYVVDNSGDKVSESSGNGTDTVSSKVSFTLGSNVENLTLTGTGGLSGTGNGHANSITGNTGANTLKGLGGVDKINGGNGADRLYGGTGADQLTGGAGADKFYFDTGLTSSNVDKILDFSSADDTLYLDDAVFSALANGTLAASAFRIGTAAADSNDRIIYDQATGKLYYDADGSGSGDAVQFAQVTAGTDLSNSDFYNY